MGTSWVGAWKISITIDGQEGRFPGLFNFFADGNAIADESPMPFETTAHGHWVATGPQTANCVLCFLVGSAEPGVWQEVTIQQGVIYQPAEDRWGGPFTIAGVDQSGKETFSHTGMIHATRLAAQA